MPVSGGASEGDKKPPPMLQHRGRQDTEITNIVASTIYQIKKGKSMDVFDSMEPWRQAEQLAADADFRESVLPKCARCGRPITDSKLVYIPAHDEFYCLDCIDSMTEFNEEAEVE